MALVVKIKLLLLKKNPSSSKTPVNPVDRPESYFQFAKKVASRVSLFEAA